MSRARTGLVWGGVAGILAALLVGGPYLAYRLGGVSLLIDSIVYLAAFLFMATIIPILVLLKAPGISQTTQKLFGKLHFLLGQVAYGVGFLVQRDAGWALCRGRAVEPYTITANGDEYTIRYKVRLDGEWWPVAGAENMSVLGWRPFGILRDKTERTLQAVRVDDELRARKRDVLPSAAEIAGMDAIKSVGDGGETVLKEPVERGGTREVALTTADVPDEAWLVDLKQLYARGIERVGDIKLVEKAEEITMRNDTKGGAMANRPLVGSIVGLILGIITGYVILGGMS